MAVKCTNCGGAHPSWDRTKTKREGRGVLAIDPFEDVKPEPKRPADTFPLPKPKIGRPRKDGSTDPFSKKEYQREYMADQRTIKRLGLEMTVAEFRKINGETK